MVRIPRTPYEITVARLRKHLRDDADLLEDGDQEAIRHAIHLLECVQDARVLGTSVSMAAFTRNMR